MSNNGKNKRGKGKKLVLQRETVKELTMKDLHRIAGGTDPTTGIHTCHLSA
jgi:hypothetical protein